MTDEEAVDIILKNYSDVEVNETLKIDFSERRIKDKALSILEFLQTGSHNYEMILSIKLDASEMFMNWVVKETGSENPISFTTSLKSYPLT